jgi:hypothetical protein
MRRGRWPGIGRLGWPLLGFGLGALLLVGLAEGQQIHRNGFEASRPGWLKGGFDAPYDLKTHAVTDQIAHEGRQSEYINLLAKTGRYVYFTYPTGKAVVGEELSATLWLKANRPGIQLLARVVLPRERDPNNLDYVMTTYVRSPDVYQQVGQWQMLSLGRPVQLVKQQQQLMQAQLKRTLDFGDAYIDALVLNLYAGPGPVEAWIDDVEVGPIAPETLFKAATRPAGRATDGAAALTSRTRPSGRAVATEFSGNHLVVNSRRFLFRGIRVTDTPISKLREARFNAVFLDQNASAPLIREAAEEGLLVVPRLRVVGDDAQPVTADALTGALGRFNAYDSTLFVHLGTTLASEQAPLVAKAVQSVRSADAGRVLGADVWDGMTPYSRTLNLLGVHRWPLMTTLELPEYRRWLQMRHDLANPNTFMWTWIQTHMPEWYTQLLYDRPATASFDEPIGPQAEHVRLLTYTALASGCRGLAFWSDRFLADSHQGRDRLLTCALLNLEMEMLEPLLVRSDDASETEWVDTSSPDVKAAVLRSPLGIVVLPVWQGKFAQIVPGQAALNKLSIVVPQVPASMQGWDVSPGEVHSVRSERVVGGTKVTLPEFGLTAAIVFTSDTALVARFQEQAKSRRQLAATWTYDMAVYELEKVLRIEDQLERLGQRPKDADELIKDAQKRLNAAKQYADSHVYGEAYREAGRSLRPIRILMRAQWEAAVRGLDTPVTTPYAVSFFTLPRHWQMMAQVKNSRPTGNVLPGGDFERLPQRPEEAWRIDEPPSLDEVEVSASRVSESREPPDPLKAGEKPPPGPREKRAGVPEGEKCAMLEIKPKEGRPVPRALERTLVALTSPTVKLPPGTIVQISGHICIPAGVASSPDGALLYDSAGGEPLAIRLTAPMPWKKFTVYRRVPASGTINVTVALTGIGTVYFDDIRVEPLVPPGPASLPSVHMTARLKIAINGERGA